MLGYAHHPLEHENINFNLKKKKYKIKWKTLET